MTCREAPSTRFPKQKNIKTTIKKRVCLHENRAEAENREESACGALLRALHAPGGADEERIARGCPASMCTAP